MEADSPSADGSQHQSDQESVLTLGGFAHADSVKEATALDGAEADGAISQSER